MEVSSGSINHLVEFGSEEGQRRMAGGWGAGQGKERGWIVSKMSTPHTEQLQNTPPGQRASAVLVSRICAS